MVRNRAALAAAFAAMGIFLAVIVNYMFSPGFVWWYYAAYGLMWWPMAAFFLPRRVTGFSLMGSALTIVFLAAVNLQTSPGHPWFLYTLLPLVWWPISQYFSFRGRHKGLSLVGAALTAAWLVMINLVSSPGHPWFLYACWPVLWWPVVMYSGRRAGTVWFAVMASAATIAWYTALNVFVSPGYPWAIYPAFAVLWWPMSMYFARRARWMGYAAAGSLLISVFFAVVNLVSSPGTLWAVYPIFAVVWWPLAVYYFKYQREKIA